MSTAVYPLSRHVTAIQTTYRGIRFRSRTEARWAAFFDELGWPWEYEPHDLVSERRLSWS